MGLNIIATFIPTIILQLIILPSLAGFMSDEKYGLLVTILALLNVVPSTMGNALNNIRLICGGHESDNGTLPDYNVLLISLAVINLLIVGIFSYFYENSVTVISMLLTLITSVLWLMREYYIVAFRIQINYFNIVLCNIMLGIGYCVGFVVFLFIHHWQFIYILGYLISLIFICAKCNLWKEPFQISANFNTITRQTILLIGSNILTRITIYADKMLIFPILGGAMVSVYYAATLFGKIVSLAITPVSSVMLSYLAKEKQKNDKDFKTVFISSSIVCILGYVVCLLISRPILYLIYPQYVEKAMNYIVWTTGTVVLTALISVLNPFVLKFVDMKWQIIINGVYAIVYVVLSMSFLYILGLTGFCIGTLISSLAKLIFILIIYGKCKTDVPQRT